MKIASWKIAVVCLFAILLQGCAHTKSTFTSPNPGNTLSDEIVERLISIGQVVLAIDIKRFKIDGHFYTTNFVLEAADVRAARADRIGCFSQAPDEIAKYNAIPVSIFGVFDWKKRSHIVNALHSLHGGNHAAVVKRRAALQGLIHESYHQARPDWETGFLVHALGDSYAHVKGDFDSSTAYGEVVGHGFALQDPDNIYAGDNYKKYNAYILALFDAIADPINKVGRARLVAFTEQLEATVLERKVHGKDLIDTLERHMYSPMQIKDCKDLFSEIEDKEVLDFLANLAIKLK